MPNHLLLAIAVAAALAAPTKQGRSARGGAGTAAPAVVVPPTSLEDDRVTVPSRSPASGEAGATPSTSSGFTLDTPIASLIADPAAKAVLDRDLPGLSDDANLAKFEAMSLRQFQPLTGGQLDEALMTKVGSDLAALVPGAEQTSPPPSTRRKGRRSTQGR